MLHNTPKLHNIGFSQFLLCLFEHYHEGVLVTDQNGILTYYNKAMAKLDGLDSQNVLGRSITDIYKLDTSQSITLTALRLARPIINQPHIYQTVGGKLVNSISSAYPIFDKNVLVGAVCTVVDYSVLEANYSKSQEKAKVLPKSSEPFSDVVLFEDIIANNEIMRNAIDTAKKTVFKPSSVMLVGETGTGKELFARAIHYSGQRATGPFLAINCALMPSALLEGILFGTSKGAFTGALDKPGLFELANGGTLFLDELNFMPMDLQPKLLRALQDRKIRRIGSGEEMAIDVRIISSINDSPFKAIEQGSMRSDLFYRLGVVMVYLPPLRDRKDDIVTLLDRFVKKFNKALGYHVNGFSSDALAALLEHSWPGNVGELEHAVEAAMNVIEPTDTTINLDHLKSAIPLGKLNIARYQELSLQAQSANPSADEDMDDDYAREIAILSKALQKSRGNVARAAKSLAYSPQRLHYRIKKLGVSVSTFKR
ncbi:MAG: sigma 54-interacting transcriptional regulator [Deltaproteobacteria bacterium]|jgi:arginine utilization regulatory protein|nr:sigma 54-interacting transcriptional regulator [Deltaproteobacteria bacterium]